MPAPELTTVAPTLPEGVLAFKRLQDALCGEGAIKTEGKMTFEKKGCPVEGMVRKVIENM